MMTKEQPRLAQGELELLEILWRTGGSTLSEAHQADTRKVGYTTIQTRLNRLVQKKLVRKSHTRPALYEAVITPEQASATDLDLLIQRVNQGQVVPLVAHLVRERDLDSKEIRALKSLIKEAERRAEKATEAHKENSDDL